MRHRVSGRKLGRTRNERKALFKSLITSLVISGRIKTTEAKAKAVRGLVDRLITRAKIGGLSGRRSVAAVLHDKKVVNKLVDEIVPRYPSRTSGFTRILKLGQRRGDSALVVELSLVEGEDLKAKKTEKLAPKSRKTNLKPPKKK